MLSVSIRIPADLQGKGVARAAEAGHPSIEQYVEALIRADVEGNGRSPGGPDHLSVDSEEELEALLLQRVDDTGGGDVEATPEFWRDLKARALNRADGRTGQ